MTRVGIVGYGMAGRGIHRRLIREVGLEVAGIATSNPERVAAARDDEPAATVVPDLAALIETRPDVVVLASPTGAHVEQALHVIEAGLPLIIDKPIAANAVDAQRIVQAAESAGVPLSVFQNRRFDPDQRTLRRLIQRGELGDVLRLERRWERFRPAVDQQWRGTSTAAEGGGVLLDLGAHLIDHATNLLGRVTHVYAEMQSHHVMAEDDVFLSCQHKEGVTSHLIIHSISGAPGPYLRVLGTEAAYLLGAVGGETRSYTAPSNEPGHTGWLVQGNEITPVPTEPGDESEFYQRVPAWLAGGEPPVDPADAVHTAAVMDAARISAAEHRQVAVLNPAVENFRDADRT